MSYFRPFFLIILVTLLFPFSACTSKPPEDIQGYIEGMYTYMASPVSGRVIKLFTDKGKQVKKGEKLFLLEPEPDNYAFLTAKANWQQAIASQKVIEANLVYAKQNYERNLALVKKHGVAQAVLDQATSEYEATKSQLKAAMATVQAMKETMNQYDWRSGQKELFAPEASMVFDRYYNVGEYVNSGTPVFSLLSPENIKVIFFVAESRLPSIHYNDEVTVSYDGGEKAYHGKVSYIAPNAEYTPPVIYSLETNLKLSYRIEAIFPIDEAYHLHPGQPVRVALGVSGGTSDHR